MPAGASRICTYDAKWTHESVAYQRILSICPARLEPALERAVIDVSRRAWRLLGLRDYGRIDFRLDRRGRPVVIDVNTNPDLEEEVGFVVAAEHAGLGFDRTIGEVVAAALARPRAAAAVPTC
jgi:D-alanine-D-alanine ligase